MGAQQQGQQTGKPKMRRSEKLLWIRIAIISLALLLLASGGAILILNSLGSLSILITAIFTALGVMISFFQLFPVLFPSKKDVQPAIIQPSPTQPIPQQALSADITVHRSIIELPPPIDPRTIQQREKAVKDIYEKLIQPDITAIVLTGIGGVGKSTLAALVYRYTEEQRQTGSGLLHGKSIWLTINDSVTMTDLARTLFENLGRPVPNLDGMTPQNQAIALFKALNTLDEAHLVILDQFENLLDWQTGYALVDRPGVSEWLDIINSQPCRCRILLTSRPWPQGTHEYPPTYMQEYQVRGLEIGEGIELLQKQGVKATEAELRRAVESCEGHAFALTLLASLLRRNRSLSLTILFKDLMYTQLWVGNIARNLLDYIYRMQLSEVQRKLLLAFSIYREPVPLDAAQPLVNFGVEVPGTWILPALQILITQHLLQAIGEGCYQLHAIVASYAEDHFDERNERANRQALQMAHSRAAQYYLQKAVTSCPPREQRKGSSDVHLFIESIWQLCQAGQWQEAYNLMEGEEIFFDLNRWGDSAILLELCQLLLPSDRWYPEGLQAGHIYNDLGRAYNVLGKKEEALKYYEEALRIRREVGDRKGEGTTLNDLGWVYGDLGKKAEALKYLQQALQLHREVGDRREEGWALSNLGWIYGDLGEKEEALNCLEQALSILREIGDRWGEGRALNNLGKVYNALGKQEEALKSLEQALSIVREVGDRRGEGLTLHNLSRVYNTLRKQEEALKSLEQALGIVREVGDREEEGRVLDDLGNVYATEGKEQALMYYKQALDILREVGDHEGEGITLYNTGTLYFKHSRYAVSLACFLIARHIFEEVPGPNRDEVEKLIDHLREEVGKEQFAALLTEVEPQAHQIVEQAINEKIDEKGTT